MFRLLEAALLVVCLIAVGAILYGYYKQAMEARKRRTSSDLDQELTSYLKNKRKE